VKSFDGAGVQASSVHGSGSVYAGSRMDNSYVVLPNHRVQSSGFPPPRPRTGGIHYPTPGATTSSGVGAGQHNLHQPIIPGMSGESHAGRAMDESFVVLPSAASMYRFEVSGDGAGGGGVGRHGGGSSGGVVTSGQHTNNASFNATVNVLTRVFEIASAQTQVPELLSMCILMSYLTLISFFQKLFEIDLLAKQVDQPLCLECMHSLSDELDKQVEDVSNDIKAYQACLDRLNKDSQGALSEEDFAREKLKVQSNEISTSSLSVFS
jgi:beclin 1